ncbi:hypothetical protein IKQ21_06640 [bacterium]|nr:hypothetical protein [bacterium]
MNIETIQKTNQTQQSQQTSQTNKNKKEGDVKFSDELKTLSKEPEKDSEIKETKETEKVKETNEKENVSKTEKETKEEKTKDVQEKDEEKTIETENPENAIVGLSGIVEEMAKITRTEEMAPDAFKNMADSDDKDNKREDLGLIDNNMNIQEPKDRLTPDLNTNMNFNSNGQPFSDFINPENGKQELKVSAKDIAEEKEILSTMEENIAIANKNMAIAKDNEKEIVEQPKTKTVTNESGIKKVERTTNITVDTIASFDSVIMDKSDVEFFSNLVDGNIQNLSEVKNPEKSAAVSKTLADLLAKAMENNKPIRINFDNDISVIIRVDRNGKISADFLPSSQVAEAYLRENLPLLRQRFDDNNIDYNELNQRKQNKDNNENRKKDRKDE